MLISALAKRTGATARALRRYEDHGLQVPTPDANGYRTYAESDVRRVIEIREMIAAGMGTDAVGRYLDCAQTGEHSVAMVMCPDLRAELDALVTRLDSQQNANRTRRELLCSLASGREIW